MDHLDGPARPGGPSLDEDQYRREVLRLPSREAECSAEQSLVEEAQALGLDIPAVEIAASLAASIASGIVRLPSPSGPSSGSSTDRNSFSETPVSSSSQPPLDQLVSSSYAEITVVSRRGKSDSGRSVASLSTRPTSYSSNEGRQTHGGSHEFSPTSPSLSGQSDSTLSVLSSAGLKSSRRSSLKNAIGRIYFRKKRTPSSILLPPTAQITIARGESGQENVVVVESQSEPRTSSATTESLQQEQQSEQPLKVEVPVYDSAALQRSMNDPQLVEMHELHQLERNRHIAFQNAAISLLRQKQQAALNFKMAQDKQQEEEKREKNLHDISRMEERQLVAEMEQRREFDKAKMNSRTRIKHMEGYLSTSSSSSPPQSPRPEADSDWDAVHQPLRKFTSQHKAQLAQEYHDHDSMDQLHEARIKVLRDQQEIKLQEAMARMAQELDSLVEQHAEELAALQRQHQQEELSVLQALHGRKIKLRRRWTVEEAVLRKKLELRDEGLVYGPLPVLSFTQVHGDTGRDSGICVVEGDGRSDASNNDVM
ncbi:hypothetical protein ASPZODRAFT_2112226 [Penicilliopsis zonata CBS 506.65]|uniref:Uncharacterized protein n=1 Tax=Penicilliopsis zonata CBS 506.65 TaxID=1073090 RepID=A0A1L9SAN5_9EURO|nr:hypothetical protein ASPZODRAFT_2112226 [Penicilliopsis zonata CBS 506.65]OJJ44243.1 hypothetical protein ASPZODRAFT_2112226 [Penicilliopsis zonata CBS 506.65]